MISRIAESEKPRALNRSTSSATISAIYRPAATIPTTIEFVDIAGLVAGAATGEGLGNKFLSHIREVDAVAHVVRCFDDPDVSHVSGHIDPGSDIETINLELALADLGTVLGLLAAAITIALSDVVRSLAGWVYVNSRSGVEIGSRVEVEGTKGDVIDIGLLKTTLLEVGEPMVHGLQSTGRIVTMPNSVFLDKTVFSSASESPLIWQELQILVTFESDWKRARDILRDICMEQYHEIVPELKRRGGSGYGMKKLLISGMQGCRRPKATKRRR